MCQLQRKTIKRKPKKNQRGMKKNSNGKHFCFIVLWIKRNRMINIYSIANIRKKLTNISFPIVMWNWQKYRKKGNRKSYTAMENWCFFLIRFAFYVKICLQEKFVLCPNFDCWSLNELWRAYSSVPFVHLCFAVRNQWPGTDQTNKLNE